MAVRADEARHRVIAGLDPRRSLAAAIGWAVFGVVAIASLVAANLSAGEAERTARADAERLLAQFATQIHHELSTSVRTRLSIVRASAAQIAASGDRSSAALRRHLEALRTQFPEFVWLGVAAGDGRIEAATGDTLIGESVADSPWFERARAAPFLGEGHVALPVERRLRSAGDGEPQRFVDVAAPIADGAGRPAAVLGAHLAWEWIDGLQSRLLDSLDAKGRLELLLASREGLVTIGPAGWAGRTLRPQDDLTEHGSFVVGRHTAEKAGDLELPWTVLVRQPAAVALAPAQHVRTTVFLTVLLAGLAMAVVAALATRALTRRLAALADDAQAVRVGGRQAIAVPKGNDEVSHIGAAMAELVDHLQHEKATLATLNAELDARVAERTARIERMADEARHAAVTRERLRLARDLHDTLAHSLMALLTQIRLVRKMKGRLPAAEVEAELASAEQVAASGLAEARAAISQMRHGGVRESGLAAALRDLLSRFGERTGVKATLQVEGSPADLADERAETVFRIAEEALRNVERHAHARSVRVVLTGLPGSERGSVADERVAMEVQDDGVGFDASTPHPGHFGLVGIREQAALIGARLELRSAPGEGTRLRIEFAA